MILKGTSPLHYKSTKNYMYLYQSKEYFQKWLQSSLIMFYIVSAKNILRIMREKLKNNSSQFDSLDEIKSKNTDILLIKRNGKGHIY